MTLLKRFLDYVSLPTASDERSHTVPTTDKQFVLGRRIVQDLLEIGVKDAALDERCYVWAHLPATPGYESCTKIGFIAHLDTSPDFADEPVKVQIHEHYDGGDVPLSDSGRILSPAAFPHLKKLAGRTLLTTDGRTLLGADDKAGAAEILCALSVIQEQNLPHGLISVAFTPDEECGVSCDHFDLERFGAEFAYTVDGGAEGEVVYETFNACDADFELRGFNIHPGSAKNRMLNAALLAMEVNAMLPSGETPRHTEGREGFYHLCSVEGNVERASLHYIVRDHSASVFEARKETLRHIEKRMNEQYGAGTVSLTIRDSYRNMEEKIRPVFRVVELAEQAVREAGLEPIGEPVRGGTDGSHLSFMGLPTPNLGTGGYAFHGPYEHITVEGMEKAAEILVNLIRLYADSPVRS